MRDLTEKQSQVLRFIYDYCEENACPPTVREVATHFEVSLKAAQDHIAALRKKNCLSPSSKRSRSLKVLVDLEGTAPSAPASISVSILGYVAAGKPLMSEENFSGVIHVPETMLSKGKNYFALNIKGESMINAGILHGDLAIIEQCETAENGQIVVAALDDSITLKRFFKETSRVRLQPENSDFKPIYSQDVRILGKLSAVIRMY